MKPIKTGQKNDLNDSFSVKQFVVTNSEQGATRLKSNQNYKIRNSGINRYIKRISLLCWFQTRKIHLVLFYPSNANSWQNLPDFREGEKHPLKIFNLNKYNSIRYSASENPTEEFSASICTTVDCCILYQKKGHGFVFIYNFFFPGVIVMIHGIVSILEYRDRALHTEVESSSALFKWQKYSRAASPPTHIPHEIVLSKSWDSYFVQHSSKFQELCLWGRYDPLPSALGERS